METTLQISVSLTQEQIGKATILLTDAQLASIHQQETAPPVTPPASSGDVALPTEVAGRQVIKSRIAWVNGAPRLVADLNDGNVWAIAFTPGEFTTARFAGGEWQSQQTARMFAIVRNRDGAVIVRGPSFGTVSPSVNLVPTAPAPHSGKYQVVPGEAYTLAIWNAAGPGRMFMEFYYQ